jgi:hypothetical protein
MADKETNIDIIFRNGLKDHEILPPPEIWVNIAPRIRKSQQPFLILRSAAMIAVLLSLTFLAYKWSFQYTSGLNADNIIINPESQSPVQEKQPALAVNNVPEKPDVTIKSEAVIPVTQMQEPIYGQNEVTGPQENEISNASEKLKVKDLFNAPNSALIISNKKETVAFNEYMPVYFKEETPVSEKKRWTIAALVSPTYYTNFSTGNNEAAAQLMSEEKPLISYAGGLALSYKINKRLSVQSGLYYSSYGNELTGINSYGGFRQYDYTKDDHNFEVISANGKIYTNNGDVFLLDNVSSDRILTRYTNDVFDPAKANLQYIDNSLKQNFSYLELPFTLRYKIIDKALDFNIIGGVSSNILVGNSVYANLDGSKYNVGKTEGLNIITFSSSIGMGMEYNIASNLSLNLEPTFRYYLNPFSEVSGMRIHPYSFGIFSGISYKF